MRGGALTKGDQKTIFEAFRFGFRKFTFVTSKQIYQCYVQVATWPRSSDGSG